MKLNLLEVLRAFPGGIPALADATLIPYSTLRDFGLGKHRRIPWKTIRALCAISANAGPGIWPEAPPGLAGWVAAWTEAAKPRITEEDLVQGYGPEGSSGG